MSLTKKDKMDAFRPKGLTDVKWNKIKAYTRKLSMRALTAEQITKMVSKKFKL